MTECQGNNDTKIKKIAHKILKIYIIKMKKQGTDRR